MQSVFRWAHDKERRRVSYNLTVATDNASKKNGADSAATTITRTTCPSSVPRQLPDRLSVSARSFGGASSCSRSQECSQIVCSPVKWLSSLQSVFDPAAQQRRESHAPSSVAGDALMQENLVLREKLARLESQLARNRLHEAGVAGIPPFQPPSVEDLRQALVEPSSSAAKNSSSTVDPLDTQSKKKRKREEHGKTGKSSEGGHLKSSEGGHLKANETEAVSVDKKLTSLIKAFKMAVDATPSLARQDRDSFYQRFEPFLQTIKSKKPLRFRPMKDPDVVYSVILQDINGLTQKSPTDQKKTGRNLLSTKVVVSLHTVCVETNDFDCEAFQNELKVQGALKFTAEGRHEKSGFKWLHDNFGGAACTDRMQHKLGKDGNVDIPATPPKAKAPKNLRPPAKKPKLRKNGDPEEERQRRRELRNQRRDDQDADQSSIIPPLSHSVSAFTSSSAPAEGATLMCATAPVLHSQDYEQHKLAFAEAADDASSLASPPGDSDSADSDASESEASAFSAEFAAAQEL